jgi:hypothetical protein
MRMVAEEARDGVALRGGNGAAFRVGHGVGQGQPQGRGRVRAQTTGRAYTNNNNNNNNTSNNNTTANDTTAPQVSPLFCASQPTQQLPRIPTPRRPIRMFNSPIATDIPFTAATRRPIRMVNVPVTPPSAEPKRPVITYRGKDSIKQLVSNKKLQAIFAGKPLPKEPRVFAEERMELRMSAKTVVR